MARDRFRQTASQLVLCISIVLVTVLFGVRVQYSAAVYYLLAIIQIALIAASAWTLGASDLLTSSVERKMLVIAGLFLIVPWIFFSLVPGFGTPWQATAAENQTRYIVLLAAAAAVGSGMIFLWQALVAAGEKLYSTLGFAAILFATPLYLVWASILFEANFVRAHGGQIEPAVVFITDFSDLLLYFGGLFTYLSSAAFAVSLGKAGLLGRWASRAATSLSLLAILFLIIRGAQFPNPEKALDYWYNIPGFVAGIPAIPWFIPSFMGIALLRTAADDNL